MTYVIPAGFSRLTFDHNAVSTQGSKPSWGIGTTSPPDATLLAEVVLWWEEHMAPLVPEYVTLERVQMRSDALLEELLPNSPGTDEAAFGPPSQAALVSLSSGLVGRANRGRIYVPYVLPETALSGDGIISPTRRGEITFAFQELQALLAVDDFEFVILHSTELAPTPVTSWTVQELSATQRRRLRG